MKKHGGSKTKVMLALLAVLLVSLGYLSMQGGGREGMCSDISKKTKDECTSPNTWTDPAAAPATMHTVPA